MVVLLGKRWLIRINQLHAQTSENPLAWEIHIIHSFNWRSEFSIFVDYGLFTA